MSEPIKAADLARKHDGKQTNGRWLFRCPCIGHGRGGGDKNPSLLIWDADDGLAIHCHAECSRADVLQAFDLTEQDVRPPKQDGEKDPKKRKRFSDDWLIRGGFARIASYVYATKEGDTLYEVLRYEYPTEKKALLAAKPGRQRRLVRRRRKPQGRIPMARAGADRPHHRVDHGRRERF